MTWQATTGERTAVVVMPFTSGFVIGGRSPQATEQREDALATQVEVGCLVTLAATYLAVLATQFIAPLLRIGTRETTPVAPYPGGMKPYQRGRYNLGRIWRDLVRCGKRTGGARGASDG